MPTSRWIHTLLAAAAAFVVRSAPLHAQSGDARAGLQPLEMFPVFGADAAPGDPAVAESAQTDDVHGVIVQYRNALRGWLTTDERARMDAIDASGTADIDAWRLRYLAADRALHRFAPMALDAVARTREAARLRSAAPIVDERSALGAVRIAVVAAAMRRRDHVAVATADAFARSFVESPLETSMRADFETRVLAADRAVIAAAGCAARADIGEAAESARDTADAFGAAVEDRAAAVDAALELLHDMIAYARGVQVIEPRVNRPMPAGDPFEPVLEPVVTRRRNGARMHAGERIAHARPLPTFDSFIGLPP